jgi:YggT family protein
MLLAHTLVRYLVLAAFGVSVLAALASWLVRTRRVSPLGGLGRTLRAASDPLIRPVERRVVRLGGNPVHAGWWLAVGVAAGGVLLLVLLDWLVSTVRLTTAALRGGPRVVVGLAIVAAYNVLFIALVVRVVAAWFGWFEYARWMRPVYTLTNWLILPIRRLLPPLGGLDWSPLAALLVLWVVERMLLTFIAAF